MPESFALSLSLNRVLLAVHLGYEREERIATQSVAIDVRLYFRDLPAVCEREEARFICYDKLTRALASFCEKKEFRLLEFLGKQLFDECRRHVRSVLPALGEDGIRIVMDVTKCDVPVEEITKGCTVRLSDLPGGVPVHA